MIGIIDYEAGNLYSVEKAVKKLGYQTKLIREASEFTGIDKIIFPGVGNAKQAMKMIRLKELNQPIQKSIDNDIPFLGICLGMQLLMEFSKENDTDCLSIFPGKVLPFQKKVKVPHMGWNEVQQVGTHPIFQKIPDRTDFYFVHSFYVSPAQESDKIGITDYGADFCSVIGKDHVIGVQFHPEKSAEAGLTVLQNFYRYV
ncbi:imidazole glycerol phosphate synthase subunit HisH [Lederbergia sp. NSJ-179]|uniref:imidazole glycerol phosphate synthase subunit HisH n=1 Tax=Lederbergia sp. NSJ-179 TaxID=2931402 RepID=UPI001FD2AECF|nr:imidazole glycerol phosphate synthase subunit HisH [Lederbergia sp. NSJ-179]MCJ7842061.1 imidazole glycerol phosphate synthase subunit HisH [Lederbergia sp. NSJ-179]